MPEAAFQQRCLQKARTVLWLTLVVLMGACAEIATPTGGPKDTEGPTVLEQRPAQAAVNVEPDKIVVTYNEFITIKDAFNQVLISPPLANDPEYIVRGRRLEIRLFDTLQKNRTYRFYLGEAVRDLNESNVVQQQEIVFSTGPTIDSLTLKGSIQDAFDASAAEGMMVLLHAGVDLNVLRDQPPTYATRTDKNGAFAFTYLAHGTYTLSALEDANFNYRYDLPNERIAFRTEVLKLRSDTVLEEALLRFEADQGEGQLIKARSPLPGQINATFNGIADTATVEWTPAPIHVLWNPRKDSVKAWFARRDLDSVLLRQSLPDTLVERYVAMKTASGSAGEDAPPPLRINTNLSPKAGGKGAEATQEWIQELNAPLMLRFNRPVVDWDTSRITLIADSSGATHPYRFAWVNGPRTVAHMTTTWPEATTMRWTVLPGAFTGLWETTNDSLQRLFNTKSKDAYGAMEWTIRGDTSSLYLLELLNSQDVVVNRTRCLGSCTWNLDRIAAGSYRMRAIVDRNQNGRWDPGALETRRQPEPVRYHGETLSLRANWTLENIWDINNVQKADNQP